MPHNHEFDCKQCGAHLDSRQELDRHVHDKHTIFSADTSASEPRSASSKQAPSSSSSRATTQDGDPRG